MKGSFQSARASVPLREQRDYRLLWSARTISITGSEVSKLAVPLTAITLLAASPLEMGLLTAAASVPALLFGLHAGAIADRLRRHRPTMIACELVSCAAALTVPLAWVLGVLTVPWLLAVALVIGTAAVLFRAVNFPYVASIVAPDQRTAAMAGFNASYSVASVAGPGLAGALVQILTAPLAVLVEGVSFLISALLLRTIKTPEHREPAPSRGLWRDVAEGLRAAAAQPVLRALLGAGVTINFFATAYVAVWMLYMLHALRIPANVIGLLIALSGAGGILGAWATTRLAQRYGENKVLLGSVLFFPLEILAVGLVDGPLWWKITVLAVAGTATGAIVVAFASCMSGIVMRDTPEELRGRVNATLTFAVQGVMALGGVAGGVAGEVLGLRAVILLCAAGIATATLWIWTSPLRPGSSRRRSSAARRRDVLGRRRDVSGRRRDVSGRHRGVLGRHRGVLGRQPGNAPGHPDTSTNGPGASARSRAILTHLRETLAGRDTSTRQTPASFGGRERPDASAAPLRPTIALERMITRRQPLV